MKNTGFKGFEKEIIVVEKSVKPTTKSTYELFNSECILVQNFMKNPAEYIYSLSRQADIEGIFISLHGETIYPKDNSEPFNCIIGEIRWGYTTANTYRNFFTADADGYRKCCEWLDKKRVLFGKSIMPNNLNYYFKEWLYGF